MPDVPQELLDLLHAAEEDLIVAAEADRVHGEAIEALDDAIEVEEEAKDIALDCHQTASFSATNALKALKNHFGIE